MKSFKLVVQPSQRCIEVLQYLDDNIQQINRIGIMIKIEKLDKADLDEATVRALHTHGIARLPALIIPGQKRPLVGSQKIIDLFGSRMNTLRTTSRIDGTMDSNTDLSEFWKNELFSNQNGTLVPRKETEPEDQGAEIMRRMNEYQTNQPKHRQNNSANEMDNVPTRPARRTEPIQQQAQQIDMGGGAGGGAGGDVDDRMLAAWLDNNVVA